MLKYIFLLLLNRNFMSVKITQTFIVSIFAGSQYRKQVLLALLEFIINEEANDQNKKKRN